MSNRHYNIGELVKIKGYIISVMCISVIGSLISMLAPEGEGGGLGGKFRLVYGLCVVLVCINPIKSIVLEIKDLDLNEIVGDLDGNTDNYADYLNNAYTAAEVESLKSGIRQMLSDRFGVASENCEVEVSLYEGEGERAELESICITLYGPAIFKNTAEMEEYFGAIFECEIITVIG